MGFWVSKPKGKDKNIVSLDELKDQEIKEITDLKDLTISQSNFVLEKNERFRDYYKVGGTLGTSSFGEVRKCVNKFTNAVRAWKILNKSYLDDKHEKLRFFYEMEIMKMLDHPNILRIYEIYQDHKRYFLITELCTGGELFQEIVKRKKFLEKDAALVIEQILEAISYCHSKGIVHRDLKPENILIDSKNHNTIKVIDFGTSQKVLTGAKMTEAFGTSTYIAPEVLTTEYDEKWDVWSIGVIMFILLSGKPPFDGETDREIWKRVKDGKYSMAGDEWKSISTKAKDLLKRLLTYDPKKRVSCKDALDHNWFKEEIGKTFDTKNAFAALQNMKDFKAEK